MRNGLLAALMIATMASSALAARQADDDAPPPDARTEGYAHEGKVINGPSEPLLIDPPSGSAGTWAITVICGVVCLGVLFKNGKRSHLD